MNVAERDSGMPRSIHARFAGMAKTFTDSLASQPTLLLSALFTVYIVLRVLHEAGQHQLNGARLRAMPNAIRTVRAKLLEFALGLPEAHEELPWGERVVKVNRKVFVFLGRDMDENFGLSVKLPTTRLNALRMPFTEPSGYGLGKSGWVSAQLDEKSQASFEMLRDWVLESYCAIAPRGLSERVSAERDGKRSAKRDKAKAKSANQGPAKRAAKTVAREGTAKSVSLPLKARKRTPKR